MLTSTLVLGGDVSDYTLTVQLQLRTDVANNAGVTIGDVHLEIMSGSVTVTFRIAYPDATAAATGIAFFSQPVSSISSALSGVTVISASIASLTSVTVEAPSPPPPAPPPPPLESAAFGDIAVVVALAVVGVVAACACTSFYLLRRRRQRAETERKANDLEAAEAASAAEAARIAAAPTQLRLRIRRQRELQRAEEERKACELKAIEAAAEAAVAPLELWRELGDVLISINGAEPSVEELSAALHSHGGSLESLATYARTDHSALTEELKRLGFSKIYLRKKVEQALVKMPKAPSIAGDLLGRPSGSPQPLSTGAIVIVGDVKQPVVATPPLLISAEEDDWHASASSTSPKVQTPSPNFPRLPPTSPALDVQSTPTRSKPLSPAQSMGVSPLSRVRLIPKQSYSGASVGASQIVASQTATPDRYASQMAALERQITYLPNIPVTQSFVGASCSRPVPRRSSSYIVPPEEAVAPGAAAPSEAVAASAKWLQRAELMMPTSPTDTPSDAPETPYARLKRALSFERKKFIVTPAAPPEEEEEATANEEQQHLNKLSLKRSLSFERKQSAGTSAAPLEEARAEKVAAIKAQAEARAAAFIIAAAEAAKAEAAAAEARPQEAATKLQAIERGKAARAKAADMKAAPAAAAAAAAAADEAAAEAIAQQEAATKLQAIERGKAARAKAADMKAAPAAAAAAAAAADEAAAEAIAQQEAATKLQAIERGKAARAKAADMKAAPAAAAAAAAAADEAAAEAIAQQEAATKLQAIERGKAARAKAADMKAQAAWAEAKAIAAYRLNLRQARSFGREQQQFSLEPGSGLTVFGLDSFQARLQQHVQQQQLEPPAPGSSSSPPVAAKTTLSATEQAQVWYGAGLEANAEGDSGRALDFFTQALSVEPERPSFLLSAGNMHLKLGAPAEALRLYTQCEKWLKTLPPAQALMLEEKMKTATLLLTGRRSTRPRESSPMRRQQQSSSLVGSEALERATEERLRI